MSMNGIKPDKSMFKPPLGIRNLTTCDCLHQCWCYDSGNVLAPYV